MNTDSTLFKVTLSLPESIRSKEPSVIQKKSDIYNGSKLQASDLS